VQSLSLNGAMVRGMDRDSGAVAAGKTADVVGGRGDPGARAGDIRNVTVVFKDGVGFDSAKLIESVKGQVGIR
jgi:imidazolonepropionase-like amidohydrolase